METMKYKSRQTLYSHFDNENLDYEIIQKYGRAIKHDFSKEFPEMIVTGEPVVEVKDKSVRELEAQVDYWRNKYITILEKYNNMVEERLLGGHNGDSIPT